MGVAGSGLWAHAGLRLTVSQTNLQRGFFKFKIQNVLKNEFVSISARRGAYNRVHLFVYW